MDPDLILATYRLDCAPHEAAGRAQALALEQSIEMPLAAVMSARVLSTVVARVAGITTQADGSSHVQLTLAAETVAGDAGQLMNMLFGNSSLHDDVRLLDVEIPAALAEALGGPRYGIEGLRQLTGVHGRPLTCTALKPIGSTPAELARLAGVFAAAGIDVIKDDHGWANQPAAPFEERVAACQSAVESANRGRDHPALYVPSLSGSHEQMRKQLRFALAHGVRMVLIAPMIAGVANFSALRREFDAVAWLGHPALAGNQIAAPALLGRLFRLFGADAVIFPNHGGRFSFPRESCLAIAERARGAWRGLAPTLPVPAGGMSVERVPELLNDYGQDAMLLIGGALLTAREHLAARSRAFVEAVAAAGKTVSA